jgi:uncharacterized membrane protein
MSEETGKTSEEGTRTSTGMQQNVAALLCYVAGWITGLVFFLIEKENRFVRFHAMQSIMVFGGLTVAFIVAGFLPFIGGILTMVLSIAQLVLWILLMVKAYQNVYFKLPVVGDLAEKQLEKAA